MANQEQLEILEQGTKAWNAWRKRNLGVFPDLRGASLSGAALRSANLFAAKLGGADLGGVDLDSATLLGADLRNASLRNSILLSADLRQANLAGADLEQAALLGANLRTADLEGARLNWTLLQQANLSGVNLRGAKLHRASFGGTNLGRLDLSQARGLADTLHELSSHIGTDTLEHTAVGLRREPSRRVEVEAFYRGAGVQEDVIEFFRARIFSPIEFYSCFISYSHVDKSFARRLYNDLQAQGIRCWLDEKEILPGDNIPRAIDRGIRIWDKVLLCCSKASLASWWVGDEIDKALEKERALLKERKEEVLAIIPLNLDGHLLDGWQNERAATLRKRQAPDFTYWESDNAKYQEQFEQVVKALRSDEGAREDPPEPKL